MFEAFHEEEGVGYYADQIWDKWEDPHEEPWVCCPVDEHPVTPVVPHNRERNGKVIPVASYFRMKSEGTKCSAGESEEHRKAKMLIASLIENEKVKLRVNSTIIPFSSLEFKPVDRPSFRWEQKREGSIHKRYRRGDVVFDFKKLHPTLGKGIVFELQFSELDEEKRKKRVEDWIASGYSLTWIPPDLYDSKGLLTNEIKIDHPWAWNLGKYVYEQVEMMKEQRRIWEKKLEKYAERSVRTCRSCKYGSPDRKREGMIACWYHTRWEEGTRKYPTHHEPLDTCKHYENKEKEKWWDK